MKRLTTSKLTMVVATFVVRPHILSANSAEFFTCVSVLPSSGDKILVSSLAKQ